MYKIQYRIKDFITYCVINLLKTIYRIEFCGRFYNIVALKLKYVFWNILINNSKRWIYRSIIHSSVIITNTRIFHPVVILMKNLLIIIIMALQPFVGPWPFFILLIPYTVDRTPLTGDQPVASSLPTRRTTQTQNKYTQTTMPGVGLEPTIRAFERAKTVHALDRAAGHCDLHEKG
jgi:hypothetical protein